MMTLIKRYWLVVLRYVGLLLGLGLFIKQLYVSIISYKNSGPHVVNFYLVMLAIFIMVVIYFVQVRLWMSAMKSIGCKISLLKALKGYWITFLPRYIPGGVWGYLGRNDWLLRDENIAFAYSNSGTLIEILMGVVGGIFVIIITIVNHIPLLSRLLFGLFIIFVTGIILDRSNHLLKSVAGPKILKMINIPSAGIRWKSYILGIVYSILNWILFGLALTTISLALSGEYKLLLINSVGLLSGAYAISWLVGFIIIIIPSGLGIRELVLTMLLTSLASFSPNLSTSSAIAMRLITLIAELAWIITAALLSIIGSKPGDNPNVLLNK